MSFKITLKITNFDRKQYFIALFWSLRFVFFFQIAKIIIENYHF